MPKSNLALPISLLIIPIASMELCEFFIDYNTHSSARWIYAKHIILGLVTLMAVWEMRNKLVHKLDDFTALRAVLCSFVIAMACTLILISRWLLGHGMSDGSLAIMALS